MNCPLADWAAADEAAVRPSGSEHRFNSPPQAGSLISLITGTKHYLGPFEAYGKPARKPRSAKMSRGCQQGNFYYTQEDVLFREAASHGFAWTVHRPHTIVGSRSTVSTPCTA
jgi:hypothetical protein